MLATYDSSVLLSQPWGQLGSCPNGHFILSELDVSARNDKSLLEN